MKSVFVHNKLDETGANGYFSTSQTKTTPPTLIVDSGRTHPKLKSGILKRIHYRLKPTNAVTYTLRIWKSVNANPYELNLHLLYESPSLQASDVDYDRSELEIPFWLWAPGSIYYSIEWSGAPGTTVGFIALSGLVVE
jgi:hypothetical protein